MIIENQYSIASENMTSSKVTFWNDAVRMKIFELSPFEKLMSQYVAGTRSEE